MPDNRCMGCMKELDAGASVCPHCGFDKDKYISPEMTLPPGSVLANGKYLIGKTLGQGGFGVTYIALDRSLKLRVAIKEYLPKSMAYRNESSMSLRWHSSMAEQNLGRDSFVKEAQKMAQMDDIPGIVRVREVFYENNTAYIVMDYVEGETLLRRLEKTGALDGKACFELLRPVMDSLSEAHEQGMIHRDISPDNIMLDKRGRVWLLDMGAAKEINVTQSGQSAHPSSVSVVKNGFSPLEQYASDPVRGKKDIGAWTDVYAMSATIFYCMSGSMLPPAPNRVLNPLLELPDIIPPNVSQVLLKGLAVMPKERIRSMEELRDAFAAALNAPDDAEARRKAAEVKRQEAEEQARQEAERRQAEEEAKRQQEEEAERQRVEEKQREWQRKIAESKERAKARRQKEEAEARQAKEAERRQAEEAARQEAERQQAEEAERQRVERERQQAQTTRQTKKPLLFVIFAVILAGALLVLPNLNRGGKCGDNATWTLNRNGLLTISGSGAMEGFIYNPAPWYDMREKIISVNIENGITSIGAKAFSKCASLTSVTMSDSVTTIEGSAFSDCYRLSSVSISDSVTQIGGGAFADCSRLSSVVIPDSVTEIGYAAFSGCSRLSSVVIPDSVTTIEGKVFENCHSLTSVTIPDSVTTIGEDAFRDCDSLTSVTIPDSVISIGDGCFAYCDSLTSVTIPGSVTNIEARAFSGCNSLTTIDVETSNPKYISRNHVLFSKDGSELISFPGNYKNSYVIPDDVTSIGEAAFYDCDNLTSVTIPDSVTSIGAWAFLGCDNLTSVTIPNSVTSIGEYAFCSCDNLNSVTIPDSVTSIDSFAFDMCPELTNISVPADAEISEYAFSETTTVTRR